MLRRQGHGRMTAGLRKNVDRAFRPHEISLPAQRLQKFLEKSIHTPPRGLTFAASRSTRGASGCDLMWGRDRRPRVCFASTHSGRSGTPPPATKGRREELADGEAITSDCLTKSAAPGCEIAGRSAARRRASGSRREQDRRCAGRRSVPLMLVPAKAGIGEGKSDQASGRKPLARILPRVIPGRGLLPASPESILADGGYGFRARSLRSHPGMTVIESES